jgi:16S rRNA (uracil1498-N3)-methyltransferase
MQVSENQLFSKLPIQSATDRIVLMGDPGGRVFTPDMIPAGTHEVTLLIGPEGGWSDEELAQVDRAGATRVRIAGGILRTETAAIQFAGLAAWARCLLR